MSREKHAPHPRVIQQHMTAIQGAGVIDDMKYSDRIAIVFSMAIVFSLIRVVYGQDAVVDNSLKSYKLPTNVQQYFQDKYKNQIDDVKCTFQETPQGPKGHLSLKGHIVLKNQQDISGDGDNRIRSIAKSFLREEALVLGLADLNEWRDMDIHWSSDYYVDNNRKKARKVARILFFRYIQNVRFYSGGNGPSIVLNIAEDDAINYLDADLAPVSSEMYNAVANKMISEEDATKIILRDLNAQGISFSKITITKLLVDSSPYIVWSAYGDQKNKYGWHWNYDINALTGEIVRKSNSRPSDPGC